MAPAPLHDTVKREWDSSRLRLSVLFHPLRVQIHPPLHGSIQVWSVSPARLHRLYRASAADMQVHQGYCWQEKAAKHQDTQMRGEGSQFQG